MYNPVQLYVFMHDICIPFLLFFPKKKKSETTVDSYITDHSNKSLEL